MTKILRLICNIFAYLTCSHIFTWHMFSYWHISHVFILSYLTYYHAVTCSHVHMLSHASMQMSRAKAQHMFSHVSALSAQIWHVTCHISHVTCHIWRHKINFCGLFRKTLIKWTTRSKNKQWFIIAFWKPNYSKVVSMIHQTKFGPYTIHGRHLDIRKVNQYK